MKRKNVKLVILLHIIIFIIVAVVVEISILSFANKKQISKTSAFMLDQINSILVKNEVEEEEILSDLKVENIEKAHAVAYILDEDSSIRNNIERLKEIAEMINVDEINIFNAQGVISGGTHPSYYGLSFDSGEQIAYFKPMLNDKKMTMCQDVTPNTASEKRMMYAMTWDNNEEFMLQIGVEPTRLIKAFKRNNISEVVNKMPVYVGMNVYIADKGTMEILGASDTNSISKTLFEMDVISKKDNVELLSSKIIHIDGYRTYCNFKIHGDYVIVVVNSTKAYMENFITSIAIVLACLFVASGIIVYILFKLTNANAKISSQMSLISSVSEIYYSMHIIDMKDYRISKIEGNDLMDKVVEEGENAADMLKKIVEKTLLKDYIEPALEFVNLDTLSDRLKGKKSIFMDAKDVNVGWLRMSFISEEVGEDDKPTKVIIATQVIEEDKKKEEELSRKANRDELTGLLNRRSYEDDILNYPDVPPEVDFVYIAIDINGLKVVNDELGHEAGDEMIIGASNCLIKTLGNYGRIYRTGGDEFVSMLFADERHLKDVIEDLERATLYWEGKFSHGLSLAIGIVTKREFSKETVTQMAKIADQRMYLNKSEYYSKKGIDRRGQQMAYQALCNLYTKILKINLTNDSYSIISMDVNEQSIEKGFSLKLSDWFTRFGKSGQVHSEDLERYLELTDINYLIDYFKNDKSSISISYRRKFEDSFKEVVMEIIPADDYKENDQNMFLFVKTVDK